jgi:hypothetical protein
MTKQRKDDDSFFIGWGETPRIDRRFLLRSSLALIALAGGLGGLVAAEQQPPGDGAWNPDDERDWAGVLVREPYPALRTLALDGTARTAYLVSSDKHGVQHRLGSAAEGPVLVRGSLIARGKNAMIAVADGDAWMRPLDAAQSAKLGDGLNSWAETALGDATYRGEILDSKCWFGAMQPGQGKPHKSCASLCIRGGLPAVFCPGSVCGSATSIPLLTTADGHAHGMEILPLVADPVIASGRLVKIGDVTQFRVALADIKRL